MYSSGSMPSLADIAAVTGNNDGFGNGSGWWVLIILFAIFGGWGGNGYGNNSGVADNYVLASDFSSLSRQIDSQTGELMRQTNQIGNGLCDGFYTQAQLTNGVQQSLATQGYETRNAITQDTIANMQNTNTLLSKLSDCCCSTKTLIGDVNYNMSTLANGLQTSISNGFCQTNYNNANNTRDIIDTQNSGTQAILAKLSQMESSAKDDKIAELTAINNDLRLAASQSAQNQYLVSQLAPKTPVPAFPVAPPFPYYMGTTFATNGTTII